jgi:hypothetical protein
MEITELLLNIAAGYYDSDLDRIVNGAHARRQLVRASNAAEMMATLEVNDEIVFTDTISPKYLKGKRAVVVGFDGDRINVRLLEYIHRGRTVHRTGTRYTCVPTVVKPTGHKNY